MDFNNLDNLYLSRDMLELLLKFGPLDDLTIKRLQYLNNHISTSTIKKEEKEFNYNDINENLKNNMSEFNFPISNKNLGFKKFEENIISAIENSSFELEGGNYEEGKNLLESVLYYLVNVKKE
jgi:glycyl-tRNA synthetase alpha subunit